MSLLHPCCSEHSNMMYLRVNLQNSSSWLLDGSWRGEAFILFILGKSSSVSLRPDHVVLRDKTVGKRRRQSGL